MDTLHIVQWNAQSLISNRLVLTKFLYDNNIHIAIISETWLKPHQFFSIKGYNIIRNDCGNNHNGVAILIHNIITHSQITTHFDSSLQNVCVKIKINNNELSVVSFYSPSNTNPPFNKNNLDVLLKSIPKPMIFGGDFNAHHMSWGCVDTLPRGKDVLDVIDENDLVLLNNGSPTTIGSSSWRANALDLTLVSPSLALSCDWSVYDYPLGSSYHLPVIINLVVGNESNLQNNIQCNNVHLPFQHNYKLVNWKIYSQLMDSNLKNIDFNAMSPPESYNLFCNIIHSVAEQSIPQSTSTNKCNNIAKPCLPKHSKCPSLPWWNSKCSEAVQNSKNAYIYFKNNPSEENYIEFKRLRALKKLILKTEKTNSWMELCNSFNRCTSLSLVWKYMRKFNKSFTLNNSLDDSWIPDFICKYTPDFVLNEPLNYNKTDNIGNNYLTDPFSYQELHSALFSRRDTSHGLDGIPYILLKKLTPNCLIIFLNLLNRMWKENFIPEEWKTDCLVPVLKPGKDKLLPDSYRPIALTSCIGKIFEQLLKQRLEFYVEQNGLLPYNQFGFRRGRSSRESICQLVLDAQHSLYNNQYLLCVFFDIAGAFNSVNISVLCNELSVIGIPGQLINWIQAFLTNRKVFVKFNNHLYGPRCSSLGVCQGGILSPLIFILYIRRLNLILGSNVKNLQYADDLVVYTSGMDLSQLASTVNNALSSLYKYFSYLNLDVNPTKSKVFIFGRKCVATPNILYNRIPLPIYSEVKFLGVTFTPKLSWTKYINNITTKANKAYNVLKSVCGTTWGADPKILLVLYKSLVRSHFEYGFLCFAGDSKLVNSLDKIQNKCMRTILGAFKTSPIAALQIETKLPPISVRFRYLKERFILKLHSLPNNDLLTNLIASQSAPYKQHMFILQDFSCFFHSLEEFNIHLNDDVLPCYAGTFQSKYAAMNIVIDSSLSSKEEVYLLLSEWTNYKFIYTDGSKNNDAVSFAIYQTEINKGVGYKINKYASIFTAEATAILFALKHIMERNQLNKNWVIVSDSMSVLKSLSSNKMNANINYLIFTIKELWWKLSLTDTVVQFVWVPSHIGVLGNENADFLARTIVNISDSCSSLTIKELDVALPYTDMISNLKKRMISNWGKHWYFCREVENKAHIYSLLDVPVNSTPWFCKLKHFVHRNFYTIINRMRIGHYCLNFHLHRKNIVSSPYCDRCQMNEVQSLDHIIFVCPSFGIQRLVLMDELLNIYEASNIIPLSVPDLLREPTTYMSLYKFVHNTINKL